MLVVKASSLGLKSLMEKRPQGTSLRVATMCSGTESPIFALRLICEMLSQMGMTLDFDHVFSAEIDPFKQAFIQRNFEPGIIFRDIVEFRKGYG